MFRTSLTDDYAASNVLCDRLAQRDSSYEDPDLPRKIAADRIEPTSFEELLAHASLPQPRVPGYKKSGVRNGIYILRANVSRGLLVCHVACSCALGFFKN